MIYWLHKLGLLGGANLFGYQTFRMVLGAMVAFVVTVLCTHLLVMRFRKAGLFESQDEHEDPEHIKKLEREGKIPKAAKKPSNVATMGGIAIVSGILSGVLLAGDLSSQILIGALLLLVGMGAIGFLDDLWKMRSKKGIPSFYKFWLVMLVCALVLGFLYYPNGPKAEFTEIWFLFAKNMKYQLGAWYALLFIIFVSAGGHAVNVTDGIDGLSSGLVMIAAITLAIVAYVAGHSGMADYLLIAYSPGCGEIAIFMCAVAGASMGFLWHNAAPASIYMGDTGSLALGSSLAYAGVIAKQELITLIICAVFMIELISVFIQIAVYKISKSRYFPIAPIHIVFQKIGWSDNHIVNRAYIIGIFLAILALGTLKIR